MKNVEQNNRTDMFSEKREEHVRRLNEYLLNYTNGKIRKTLDFLINSEEVNSLQKLSNIVSQKRLRMNDHGRVHMRKVAMYSLQIAELLHAAGVRLSGEEEGWCDYEDCLVILTISAFLHDVGMAIHRERHEFYSALLAKEIIETLLDNLYDSSEILKKTGIKSIILESILGHMGTQKIASKEAGILLVADGCDMENGRALSIEEHNNAKIGDIHKYSAESVEKVSLSKGDDCPIRISVNIKQSIGYFQIEEVLIKKLILSPIKKHVEVFAILEGKVGKEYIF